MDWWPTQQYTLFKLRALTPRTERETRNQRNPKNKNQHHASEGACQPLYTPPGVTTFSAAKLKGYTLYFHITCLAAFYDPMEPYGNPPKL